MGFEYEGIKQIEVNELKYILKETSKDKPIIIDIREKEEYSEYHIPGIPLIPMYSLVNYLQDLDRKKTYVFVCRSGNRSQHVAKFFKQQGFSNVANFYGGMLAWDDKISTGLENVIEDVKKLYE